MNKYKLSSDILFSDPSKAYVRVYVHFNYQGNAGVDMMQLDIAFNSEEFYMYYLVPLNEESKRILLLFQFYNELKSNPDGLIFRLDRVEKSSEMKLGDMYIEVGEVYNMNIMADVMDIGVYMVGNNRRRIKILAMQSRHTYIGELLKRYFMPPAKESQNTAIKAEPGKSIIAPELREYIEFMRVGKGWNN